jgi:hypothetical protein
MHRLLDSSGVHRIKGKPPPLYADADRTARLAAYVVIILPPCVRPSCVGESRSPGRRSRLTFFVEREVIGIEYVNFPFGSITLIRGDLGNHGGRVVVAPNDQRGPVELQQPIIPRRIAGHARTVIVEPLDMDVVLAGAIQKSKLIIPGR